MSVVALNKIEDHTLFISNVDIIDDTPLLDIKPYIPHFDKDECDEISIGWFEDKHQDAVTKKSDARFIDEK